MRGTRYAATPRDRPLLEFRCSLWRTLLRRQFMEAERLASVRGVASEAMLVKVEQVERLKVVNGRPRHRVIGARSPPGPAY